MSETSNQAQPASAREDSNLIGKKHLLLGAVIILIFAGIAFAGFRWMKNDALAVLVKFSGQPDRDVAAAVEEWFPARGGDKFNNGDGARTAKDEKARFRLRSGAKLLLKPASQIRFQRRGGKKGTIGLSVEVGEVEVRTSHGTLTLDSQFGELVIESNSLVTLKRTGGRLALAVEVGRIELGSSKAEIGPGESLVLEIGGLIVDPKEEEEGAEAQVNEELQNIDDELEVGDGVSDVDMVVSAGQSFVVHDPRPPTSIGITTTSVCSGAARVSVGARSTEARSQGNLRFSKGIHHYEVRCLSDPKVVAARGKVVVVRDSGARKLPSFAPSASVVTDGRTYTVLYQDRLPRVTVNWPSAPKASGYTLKVGGRNIHLTSPSYTLASLKRGSHRLVFFAESTPARQSRVTTVVVKYDAQAPKGRLSEPRGAFEAGSSVKVAGQALPGWSVSINGKAVEVDKQRKFSTEISPQGSLPIAFTHPVRGIHYYLRRSKGSSAH